MKKIILISGLLVSHFSQAQCVSCYSLEDALVNPFVVKELILTNKGLTEIPAEVSKMHNLKTLNLSFNQIAEIGDRLNRNEELQFLNLSGNIGLSTISAADSFYLLPNLIEIDLSNNGAKHMSSKIGEMKSLQKLNLANNSLSDIPQTLSDLPNLTYLNISNNGMENVFMSFADLWKLTYLDITGNFKMNQHEIFQNLQFKQNLKTLRCNINTLSKTMAYCLNSTGIEELIIVDSEVEKIHGSIAKNRTLRTVTFENSNVLKPNAAYRNLNSIRNLNELSFVQTAIHPSIKEMTKLKSLKIENSQVSTEALSKNKSLSSVSWTDDQQDVTPLIAVIAGQKKDFIGEANAIQVSSDMAKNKVKPIVEVKPTVKKISTNEDIVLEFVDTECAIKKETFLDNNGEVYKGKVTIELTEYFDPITSALAGAPMTAQNENGGDEIFASNGMINFSAKDENGQELKIDPEKPVEIRLRDVQPNVQGNLFSFNTSTNTWQNVGTAQTSSLDSLTKVIYDSLSLLDDNLFASFTTIQPKFTLGVDRKRNDAYALRMNTPAINIKAKHKLSKNNMMLFTRRDDMKWLAKKTWYLDTTVSKEMDSMCKSIRRAERSYERTIFNFYSSPRLLGDAQIVPDVNRDNYRMNFVYMGTAYSWPVYFKENGNLKREIAEQRRFYNRYSQKRRSYDNFLTATSEKRAKALKSAAEANRRLMASSLATARIYGGARNAFEARQYETLRFGIMATGMYNCDYFSRVRPSTYTSLPASVKDQNGERIETPRQVRFIMLEDNAYFELSKERIPIFKNKRSLVIMVISAVEIAVITSWEFISGKFVPIVKRINVEGKEPGEVRKEIFQD